MPKKDIIITVDGFSSCGKSTFAKAIAKKLSYTYIDSGAMYRAVTLFLLNNNAIKNRNVDIQKSESLLDEINIDFRHNAETNRSETILNGKNIETEIRNSPEVAACVSDVSKIGKIREKLVALQRKIGKNKRIVMDGRDIGSVVFPNAELKIFMTASPEIRAERRYKELKEKGIDTTFDEVMQNIEMRDHIDQTRDISPLIKPQNALVLDNSNMTPEEQLEWIMPYIKEIREVD